MRIFFAITFLLVLYSCAVSAEPIVYVIPVHGVIDLGLSKFVDRVCKQAKEEKVNLVILDIDTEEGRIDAANQICDSLAGLEDIPSVAFITGEAYGMGALISFACETIIMAPDSSIGAQKEPDETIKESNDKKTILDLITKFKATAERNGHSVKLAGAMADKDIELVLVKIGNRVEILNSAEWEKKDKEYKEKAGAYTVLSKKGKLLNLTAEEAKDLGLAKGIFDTKRELLESIGIKDANIMNCKFLWSEIFIRLTTYPIVISFLLTIGFLGIIFELRIPGWGLSGTLGLIALGLFLCGHYLAGLANRTEIILFLIGLILLLIKVFILPNFRIIGISGIILIIISLFLSLIKNPFEASRIELIGAFLIIAYTFLISLVIAVAGMKLLPKSHILRKLILPK